MVIFRNCSSVVRVLGIIIFSILLISSLSAQAEKVDSSPEVLFFYNPGCHHCLKVKNELLPQLLEKTDKNVRVKFLDIGEIENYQLLLELERKFPSFGEEDRPRIFIGDIILVGEKAIKEKLVEKIDSFSGKTSLPELSENSRDLIPERFKGFNLFMISAAGFLDGINPCAFAVMVFFISFLTLMNYKPREVMVIGLAFVVAVFITYFMLGLGILKGLQRLAIFYSIAKGANLIIGAFALVLAFFNFKDFYIYRKTGKPGETKLKLSGKTHNLIHRIIHKYFYRKEGDSQRRPLIALAALAFLTGVLIAICTAACTGQVYLPTIVFMLGVAGVKVKAIAYLVIYNLMYILPLVAVFIVSLMGFSSEKLANLGKRKFGAMKIILGLLFLVLGIILIKYGI